MALISVFILDPNLPWPPPDPDHIPRRMWPASAFANSNGYDSNHTNISGKRNSNGKISSGPLSNKEDERKESASASAFAASDKNININENDEERTKARINAFKARQHQAQRVSSVIRQRRKWDGQSSVQPQSQQQQQQQQPDVNENGSIMQYEDSKTTGLDMERRIGSNSRSQWRNADGERLADFGVDDEEDDDDRDGMEDARIDASVNVGTDVDLDTDTCNAATLNSATTLDTDRNESEVEAEAEDDNIPLAVLIQRQKCSDLNIQSEINL